MPIGSNIKRLRREMDMTQEELAELLGLTSAAVSGWECERNAPDIGQIPLLCHIFGVSADVLLGIDITASEERIDEIIVCASKLSAQEAAEAYRRGLAEFPTSHRLMLRLADALDHHGEPETYAARIKESLSLYEKVRESTKDPYLKNYADGRACRIYISLGKRDEAVKIAESVPRFMYSRDELDRMLSQGLDRIHEMHHGIKSGFASLCDDIYFFTMQQIDGKDFFSHKQQIMLLEKIPRLFEVFYEDHDHLDKGYILSFAYTRMACLYADMGDAKNTVRCIESAIFHANKTDEYAVGLENGSYGISDVWDYPRLPFDKRHTSLLASPEYDYPTTTFWFSFDGETHLDRLKTELSHKRFDFVRDELAALLRQ